MYQVGDIIIPAKTDDFKTYDNRSISKDEVFVVVGTNYIEPENPMIELFNFPGVCYKGYEDEKGIKQLETFAEALRRTPQQVIIPNSSSYDLETYEKSKDRLVYQFLNQQMRTHYIGTVKFLEMSKVIHPKHTLQKLEEF